MRFEKNILLLYITHSSFIDQGCNGELPLHSNEAIWKSIKQNWQLTVFCLYCILVAEAWRGIWTRKITKILCGPKRRSVGSSATRDDLTRVTSDPANFLYKQNNLLINHFNNFQLIGFALINVFCAWKTAKIVGEMSGALAILLLELSWRLRFFLPDQNQAQALTSVPQIGTWPWRQYWPCHWKYLIEEQNKTVTKPSIYI